MHADIGAGVRRRRAAARGDRRAREGRRRSARTSPTCGRASATSSASSTSSPRAREHYEAALSSRAERTCPARVQLGVTLLSLGEIDGAEYQWKKVLEIEPDNTQAKMYLRMLENERRKSSMPPQA